MGEKKQSFMNMQREREADVMFSHGGAEAQRRIAVFFCVSVYFVDKTKEFPPAPLRPCEKNELSKTK